VITAVVLKLIWAVAVLIAQYNNTAIETTKTMVITTKAKRRVLLSSARKSFHRLILFDYCILSQALRQTVLNLSTPVKQVAFRRAWLELFR
jgi:hypothetical protein